MWLCHMWKSGRAEDSDTMYIHIERGSARCFMEILIRKVENNRETNKRVEGRQNEWRGREREIVWELELGILGKQIKFTFCWNPFGCRRAVICTRCSCIRFSCCALCPLYPGTVPVPVSMSVSSFWPCALCILCVSLCRIWCPAPAAAPCTISFSTQSFVLLPRGQDEQDFVTYKPNNKLETRLAAVVKVGFDNKITFTVVALLSAE